MDDFVHDELKINVCHIETEREVLEPLANLDGVNLLWVSVPLEDILNIVLWLLEFHWRFFPIKLIIRNSSALIPENK